MGSLKETGTGRTTNIILQCVRNALDYAGSPVHCYDHDAADEFKHLHVAEQAEAILKLLNIPVTREGNSITVPPLPKV